MQARRLRFWVCWVSVTALIAMIGSAGTGVAEISPDAGMAATNPAAPLAASAVAVTAKSAAVAPATSVAPGALAEGQPAAADLAATKVKDQVGIASWYNQGQVTASGERFNPHKLTAAHRTLPLDTKVKVTNLENGKTVEVKVNDRGPYIPGRVLDLSSEAAKLLGMEKEGLALVRIEVVSDQQLADVN
jgi:rare lipoprotein A